MKQFLLALAILFSFLSCNSDSDGYVINAKIDGVRDGKLVTLKTYKDRKPITVDTTRVTNGSFTITGKVESPDLHILSIETVYGNLPFILENKNLNFTIYKDSLGVSKIEGSKANEDAQEYMKTVTEFRNQNNELRKEAAEARKNNDTAYQKIYREKATELKKKSDEFNKNYVKENNTSLFSVLLLENLLNSRLLTEKEVNDIYNSYSDELQNSASGLRIKERIDAALSTVIGATAPDFTAPNPDGKEITLSNIIGKVTIVDFWAAWCGPCRKENPNVVKVYEKYHDKGLEIIGVSLDGNPRQKDAKQEWLDAIEKDGLTWHQVSNLNYFNDPVAKKYNIQSIPATFILDSEGKIIAKNLRGNALELKIAELLD